MDSDSFKTRASKIHNNIYDYSKVTYKNVNTKVTIICPIHGEFNQLPKAHLKGHGCKQCGEVKRQKSTSFTTSEFIEEALKVHGNRYDYSAVEYHNNKTKVCIICKIHGKFLQTPQVHLKGCGCPRCSNSISSQKEFEQKATIVHKGKYEYGKYEGTNRTIPIICKTHGVFMQLANNHLLGSGCPKCAKMGTSSPELEICEILDKYNIQYRCGDRKVIFPYELDIFIPTLNIAIEYNGNFWHSELQGKTRNYHITKTNMCNQSGIRLIHIFEHEWINDPTLVTSRLLSLMGVAKRIYARKCNVGLVSTTIAKEFLNQNHMQGYTTSLVHLGLYLENELVSVMSFGKSRFNKNIEWELLRFCSIKNHVVVGGASKLFNFFVKNYNPQSVISYSDKRWNTGTLYTKLGFNYSHTSAPNYWYFEQKNRLVVLSRQHFQKHKLKNKLDQFNPDLTEWENMKNNGYNRIWDCGNDVFVWNK